MFALLASALLPAATMQAAPAPSVSPAPARAPLPARKTPSRSPYRADADYFNDFVNVVRSDDIGSVIDRHALRPGRDCMTAEQTRSRDDVLAVLDVIYGSPSTSRPALIALAAIVATLDVRQLDLLVHVLRGGTFTDYAMYEGGGVTKAAVGQRWKTIVRRCPALAYVKGDGYGAARHVLDEDVREGARRP